MDKITCLGRLQRTNWVQFDFHHAKSADSPSYYKLQTSYTRIDCDASLDGLEAAAASEFLDDWWEISDKAKSDGWLAECVGDDDFIFLLLCPACYASDQALVTNGHIPYEPIRTGVLEEARRENAEYYQDHWSPADERAMQDSIHPQHPQLNEYGEPLF